MKGNDMTSDGKGLVVVGSGMAAWTLVREFRKLDAVTPVTLVTEGQGHFYSKPMLSNALAAGKTAAQLLGTPATEMAQQLNVQLMADTHAYSINKDTQTLETSTGPVPYQRLVLATGAEPVRVPLQGDGAHRVVSINSLEDYARFRELLTASKRVVIMGAGLIGCEFANDLVLGGYKVTVVDPSAHPLGRLLPERAGVMVQEALSTAGVKFHFGAFVQSVHAEGQALRLELSSGQQCLADTVVSAVGLRPRLELAQTAGLTTSHGIVVNRQLATSHPGLYALGDGAEVEGRWLPYVMPLMQCARTLAAHLTGQAVALTYPAMPVVVKTPAIGVVVVPPPNGVAGHWHTESGPDFVQAKWLGEDGALMGFALVGTATSQKSALQKMLQ